MDYEIMEVEGAKEKGLVVKVAYDFDPISPRDWDNIGRLIGWHTNYFFGDERLTVDDVLYEISELPKGSMVFPVYLNEGNGGLYVTMGQEGNYDLNEYENGYGPTGFIYVTPETLRKEYGVKRISAKVRERATKYLEHEIEAYSTYCEGDIYEILVEDKAGNHIDSLGGLFGIEQAEEHAKEIVNWYNPAEAKAEKINTACDRYEDNAVRAF